MPGSLMLGNLFDLVEGFPTAELTTARCGDYVSLKNSARVGVIFTSGVGTGGEDPTVTLQQAKTNAGGCVKNLTIPTTKVFKKQAATDLSSTTVWASAACCVACCNTLTNATGAEQSLIWYMEFDATDLDADGGFDHMRATVGDVGCCSQPGSLTYLIAPKYPSAPACVLSAL